MAILHAPPVYRRGLLSALEAGGCGSADPEDPLLWAQAQERCAVLVLVGEDRDEMRQLRSYTRLPHVHVVALLREPTRTAAAAAIEAGADAVAAWDATTEQLVATITAAASGFVMMPAAIARELLRSDRLLPEQLERLEGLSEADKTWLQELARGCTISQLARRAGYSERAMHRLLAKLYQSLGASTRSDALVLVSRFGLFDDVDEQAG